MIEARSENLLDDRKTIPFTIPLLKAILENAGYRVKTYLESLGHLSQDSLFCLLDEVLPEIIGLSGTAYECERLARLVRYIRSVSIEYPIMIGGYCSLVPDILERTDADVVCRGEGDRTILDLVDYFLSARSHINSLSEISGISYWNNERTRVFTTESRPLIEELDGIPLPEFRGIDVSAFSDENLALPFYGQRGCYNACSFCDILPFYRKQGTRSMSPSRIVSWMKKMVQEWDINTFVMNDDNFLSTAGFLEGMIDEFTRQKMVGVAWINVQTRPNDIIRFKDLLPRLKPFVYNIGLGIESFADSQLLRFNKNISRAENLEAITILNRLGIPSSNYYMFFDEQTTLAEMRTNIETILSLPLVPNFDFPLRLPEIVVNYEYNAMNDLYGNSSIEDIDFLFYSHLFLEKTESIRKAFGLYWGLKYLEASRERENLRGHKNKRDLGNKPPTFSLITAQNLTDFQISVLRNLISDICPKIVELGKTRLEMALTIAEKFHKNPLRFRLSKKLKDRFVQKKISHFQENLARLLSPLKKMGMNFGTRIQFY